MISSSSNPQIKRIRSLAADRKERRRERMFVLEGVRLLADALDAHAALDIILYAPATLAGTPEGHDLLERLYAHPAAQEATQSAINAAAETQHPQGVIALAHWPQIEPPKPGVILVLDALQDPGNLGTLLRSAEACGVSRVLCSAGTVDAYSPKVVRAAMGAHMRLALEQDLSWEDLDGILWQVPHCYAADADARLPYYAADWRQPAALIIGNEAHGLSADARTRATKLIGIPMRGRAESLNAAMAGSVILFEALRQRSLGRS